MGNYYIERAQGMTRVERDFTNHRPSEETQEVMRKLRARYHVVVRHLERLPAGREFALAITNLEQSLMWAMAALARDDFDNRRSES